MTFVKELGGRVTVDPKFSYYLLQRPKSMTFVKELGGRVTVDPKFSYYLLQRLSVAAQRGNSALVIDHTAAGDLFFFQEDFTCASVKDKL